MQESVGQFPPSDRPSVRPSLVRNLFIIDAFVVGTGVTAALVWHLRHVLILVAIGLFVAIVLEPFVRFLMQHGLSRGLAVGIVILLGIIVVAVLGYIFVPPIVRAGSHFAKTLPGLIQKTEHGKGFFGKFIRDHHWKKYVTQASKKLEKYFSSFSLFSSVGQGALSVARSTISVIVDGFIVAVFALFALIEAPRIGAGIGKLVSPSSNERIARVIDEAFGEVTGYVLGKLFTSLLFGLVIFATLTISGVSYPQVLALWVGLADLLPLIGGLLGGIVVVPIALAHSTEAAIATLVVFLIYQQLENHLLAPLIMRKTMRLNPLWTLLAVLVGANLLGIVGALVAIPIAGMIQVLARELWSFRIERMTRSD